MTPQDASSGRPSGGSAATGAREQVARLLKIVPFLHSHGEVRLDEAARALGLSEQQLVKDLRVLFFCGLPGGYPDDLIDVDIDALVDRDGDRVIRVSNAEYLARPLRLSPTEASAIIVALRALRSGAGDEESRDVVDRALAKLEQAAAEAPQVDPGPVGEDGDPGVRAIVQQALAAGRQLEIAYFVPARDEESTRVVDPSAILTHRGVAYLAAWCHSAEAPRHFRLDRIRTARVLRTLATRADSAEADLAEGFFTRADDVIRATVRLAPQARWVIEYYDLADVRPQPDGSVEADLLVADPRWLDRLLLRLAPYAEVIAPEVFTERLRAAARSALSLYASRA